MEIFHTRLKRAGSSIARETAAAMTEYSLLLMLVMVISIAATAGLGLNVSNTFDTTQNLFYEESLIAAPGLPPAGFGSAANTPPGG